MQQLTFETKIKEYRAKLNLTQEELAVLVGVSRETISYLEKGKYNPSLMLAYVVAQAFNTTISELFIFKQKEE
jgi:putative transcriptional regulator